MARGGSDLNLELVKEEPLDEQWIKAEVDIEEHELLQHPRVRAALPHLALGGGLPAPAENQLHPAESSNSAETEALPDTRPAAPERVNIIHGVNLTKEDALVAGRWINSRVVLVDCGASLQHSDCFCGECGRLCSSSSALLCHQQAHCAPECDDAPRPPEDAGDKAARRYECDICHYTSETRRNIVFHLRIHTAEKSYKCNMCGYRCIQKSSFNRHIRNHRGGEKPFKCNYCKFRCNFRQVLNRHIRTHTGEKPFKCDLCKYRCKVRSNLKRHMTIHTGEKPLKCDLCEYKCVERSNLKRHMRTHTVEKPLKSFEDTHINSHWREAF